MNHGRDHIRIYVLVCVSQDYIRALTLLCMYIYQVQVFTQVPVASRQSRSLIVVVIYSVLIPCLCHGILRCPVTVY